MTWPLAKRDGASPAIDFRSARVPDSDAIRQQRTVQYLIDCLGDQPGAVLADEVGMGKTYVALGVAVLAALGDEKRMPSVVMVPPALVRKWPREAAFFAQHCIRPPLPASTFCVAPSALEFLRLLDLKPPERPRVIFLSHGAFHVTRIDPWTKLALIYRAMKGMRLGRRRDALPGFAADILQIKKARLPPELFALLMRSNLGEWSALISDYLGGEARGGGEIVPRRVVSVLERSDLDLTDLKSAIRTLPARSSPNVDERIRNARRALQAALNILWPQILKLSHFHCPLLVLDEAHHVKNSDTRLASLFEDDDSESGPVLTGALTGRFQRMLFLTATPFQLGHHELVNILRRFRAISWRSLPNGTPESYSATLDHLEKSLDRAQQAAADFDRLWQRIPEHQAPADLQDATVEAWWADLTSRGAEGPDGGALLRAYERTERAMLQAGEQLRPWVVRHRRSTMLPGSCAPRRVRILGSGIGLGATSSGAGLPVTEDAILPFLLAARAQSIADRVASKTAGRYTVFSDGLASSYEAFLETSESGGALAIDDNDDGSPAEANVLDRRLLDYLGRMRRALPGPRAYGEHPKIAAVTARVVDLWTQGEKVVVFCHFRRTGQALIRHLSRALDARLRADLAARVGLSPERVWQEVERFSERFDADAPMGRYLKVALDEMIAKYDSISVDEAAELREVIRRFVRSPVFIARYFDPTTKSSTRLLETAFATRDLSELTLSDRLQAFLKFYVSREPHEREEYRDALSGVQPGLRGELNRDGEDPAVRGVRMPNIRLANGSTKQESRQRLMLSFNTPFFPDILVASSVLSEGVDLHLNCRHVIHHDLSWNPSDIEQRTGRVDRIECKAEIVKLPVRVYLPFVAETQDEKQFRVVMDRERWFNVILSEQYEADGATIERLSTRIPLPPSAARALSFPLEVTAAPLADGGLPHTVAGPGSGETTS